MANLRLGDYSCVKFKSCLKELSTSKNTYNTELTINKDTKTIIDIDWSKKCIEKDMTVSSEKKESLY